MRNRTSNLLLMAGLLTAACAPLPPRGPAPEPGAGPEMPATAEAADGEVRAVCSNYLEAMRGMRFPARAVPPGTTGGWATVEFIVMPDNRIDGVRVASASHAAFAELALGWVLRLRCDGGGRRVRLQMPFMFEGGAAASRDGSPPS